ncbi:MAG: DUF4386 family protein [Actinomycetota bacterium]|nr:DUF4386 family protein [Actinomycetota bacterium]
MQQATPSTAGSPARIADKADPDALRYGRVFGAAVLAAFVLYGVGSSLGDQPIGLVLVGINSVAVALIGGIGFLLLRSSQRSVGGIYLVARLAEAILLFVGVAFAGAAASPDFDQAAYLLAMIALGVGSLPFFVALRRGRWLPGWFAVWGVIGYAMLAAGALLELASGRSVALAFAVPGGLFEIILGVFLLWRGFGSVNTRSPLAMNKPWSESL